MTSTIIITLRYDFNTAPETQSQQRPQPRTFFRHIRTPHMTTPRRLYAAALLTVIAAVNTSPAYITLLLVDVGWSKFRWKPDADFWPVFAVFVGAAAMPAAIAALLIGMKVHTRKWPHRAIITSWLSASTCFSFFRLIYFLGKTQTPAKAHHCSRSTTSRSHCFSQRRCSAASRSVCDTPS